MKPYYRQATIKDAFQVVNNIRKEDKAEIEGLGHSVTAIPFSVLISKPSTAFFNQHNEICGVAGIVPEPNNLGQIWMICTPAITHNPHTFVREAKRWLSVQQGYSMLYNIADSRNHLHQKLLKLLGFKSLQEVKLPNGLIYKEIVKLCVSQQLQ
nr:putative acetyltransferase [uncultured Mediterranean phage uvMED]BAR25548.1 putative acetyltransferase [uncultured Mediterranean phage uvMED]